MLGPGGRFLFAGEPARIGDRYARKLGAWTWKAATTATKLPALRGGRRVVTHLPVGLVSTGTAPSAGDGFATRGVVLPIHRAVRAAKMGR